MKRFVALALVAGVLVAAAPRTSHAAPINVDTAVVLLIDSSGSISNGDYATQINGYVTAFSNPTVVQGLTDGTFGQSAVIAIAWSSGTQQAVLAGWSIVSDATSAAAFGTALGSAGRPFSGTTAPGSAINFGVNQLNIAAIGQDPINFTRAVIDISSDGIQNSGADTPTARDNALAGVVDVINAIVIADPGSFTVPQLTAWYAANATGGTNENGSPAFVLGVNTFPEFVPAIQQKLVLETTNQVGDVPEPATMAVFGLGMLVAGGAYRRNRKDQEKATAA